MAVVRRQRHSRLEAKGMQVATIYVEVVKILIKRSRDLAVLVLFWLGSADVIISSLDRVCIYKCERISLERLRPTINSRIPTSST